MTHLTIQQLVAQTDGELTGASLTLVEKHISECEACWHQLERLAEQDALLTSVLVIDPGDEFFEDLAAVIEAEISGKKPPARHPVARPAEAPERSSSEFARPLPSFARPAQPSVPTPPPEPTPEPMAASPVPEPEPQTALPPPPFEPEPLAALPASPLEPEWEAAPAVSQAEPETQAAPEAPRPDAKPAGVGPLPGLESRPTVPASAPKPPPVPVTRLDPPWVPEPQRLEVDVVGAWTPPVPTLDDPFADLARPRSSAGASPRPARTPEAAPAPPAPRRDPPPAPVRPPEAPPAPPAARRDPVPAPARVPEVAPARPAPRASDPVPQAQARRRRNLAPILIGVAAFAAGLVVAVVIVMRLMGSGGQFSSKPPGRGTLPAQPVEAPPITGSPEPAPEAPPAVQVMVPPVVIPARIAGAPPSKPPARARQHPTVTAPDSADNAALNAPGTTLIPVHVIRTETVAASPPRPESAAAPAPPAPPAELGVLCGLVLDTDGHPVARAQVMMADVGVVVLTDRAGRFCLTAPVGERTLSVVALGFTTARRLVTLGKRTPELSVTLKSAAPFPTPR